MRKMRKKYKLLCVFVIVVGSVVYLLSTTFRSSLQYYIAVSEINGHESELAGRVLKVAGQARNIRLKNDQAQSTYAFEVVEGEKNLLVHYSGIVPDTFKEDASVVVTGELLPDGSFQASNILAKCASKYEAKVSRP